MNAGLDKRPPCVGAGKMGCQNGERGWQAEEKSLKLSIATAWPS